MLIEDEYGWGKWMDMSKKAEVSSTSREFLTKQSGSQRSCKLRDSRLPNMRNQLTLDARIKLPSSPSSSLPPFPIFFSSCSSSASRILPDENARLWELSWVGDQLWQQSVDGRKSSLSIWPTPILLAAPTQLYRTHCSVRRPLGRVGFSPRLFLFVRGSSLSQPCLYPLSFSSLYSTFTLDKTQSVGNISLDHILLVGRLSLLYGG